MRPSISSLNLLSALAVLPVSPLTASASHRTHLATLLFASLLRFSQSAKALAQAVVPTLAVQPPPTPSVGGAFFVPADNTHAPSNAGMSPEEELDNDDRPQTLLQTLAEHLSLSFLSRSRAIERGDGREEHEWDRLIVGYLTLLAQWLWENPNAVREFLEAGGLSVVGRVAIESDRHFDSSALSIAC
jgi:intracellular protein transport protein USO1